MKQNAKVKHAGVTVTVIALDPAHPDAKAWRDHCAQVAREDEGCEIKRPDTYTLYAGGIVPPEGGKVIFEGYGPGRFPGECSVLIHAADWPRTPSMRAFVHCDQLDRVEEKAPTQE
jgi:hypothetical protein